MERILVAVDFSSCSHRALQTAIELSKAFAARLHVVHVTRDVQLERNSSDRILPIDPYAARLERELANLVVDEFKGTAEEFLRIDKRILFGVEHVEILNEAERAKSSLIVMGTHSRSALGRFGFGSVSEQVLKKVTTPLLLVPEWGNPRFDRILLAVDEVRATDTRLFEVARVWRETFNARLDVLHVECEPGGPVPLRFESERELEGLAGTLRNEREEWLRSRVQDTFPNTVTRIEFKVGRASREIERKAEKEDFDLIILGRHPRLEEESSAGTSFHVVHRSPCAMLVVPDSSGTPI